MALAWGLAHKNIKCQVATVQVMLDILKDFGPEKLDNFKPFWKEMEKLGTSTNANLRSEAMNYYKEVTKWVGF
ncbi:MAG: hypothetical protein Q8L84_02940 [Hyphomonas sp.]|nr:hypothetical protein [Hyphomonas sp.]